MDPTLLALLPRSSTVGLPYDDFFRGEYPKDMDAYDTFMDRLAADYRVGRRYILSDLPYSVTIIERWPMLDFPWMNTESLSLVHRTVPEMLQSESFKFSHASAVITIALTRPIQTGSPNCSQVWQANLNVACPVDSVLPGCANAPDAPVIIKIFQESMFNEPEFFNERGIDSGTWRTGFQFAKAEAEAYWNMQSLQGKDVPWSYGFFKVKLPNGEEAFAHVMEFVEGLPGYGIFLRDLGVDEKLEVADAMASGLHSILQCGIIQRDVKSHNMIVQLGAAQPVVFVDFAGMVPLRDIDNGRISWEVDNEMALLIRALREMGVTMQEIADWLQDRKSRRVPWTNLFAFFDNRSPGWFDYFDGLSDELIGLNVNSGEEDETEQSESEESEDDASIQCGESDGDNKIEHEHEHDHEDIDNQA
ncbi:hypothetical protein SCP_0600900 [Sparassis crispa]|uniref:Protein kinase domain-containing protein n=1 Tax=Sparassis crispa TaxID=139825 RepID=A0A401GPJ0_9APHY|nr:hypothetical protein SCP_0600900 [Sparassis crispa]GBE84112.1 hypothetical protein SCP_0600900 [Sparassis crispa]